MCAVVLGWISWMKSAQHDVGTVQNERIRPKSTTRYEDRVGATVVYVDPATSTSTDPPMPPPPTAILHFGPRKTATTTIQAWLRVMAKHKHLLPSDRLVVRGHKENGYAYGPSQYFRHKDSTICVDKDRGVPKDGLFPSLPNDCTNGNTIQQNFDLWKQRIHDDVSANRHVLFSDEDIPQLQHQYRRYENKMEHQMKFLRQKEERQQQQRQVRRKLLAPSSDDEMKGDENPLQMKSTLHILRDQVFNDYYESGNLRVMATYRRYFDWLYSEYQQQMKGRGIRSSTRPMHGFVEWYRIYHNHVEKLEETFKYIPDDHDPIVDTVHHEIIRPLLKSDIDEWERVFGVKVQIYNMHTVPRAGSDNNGRVLPLPLHWLCETMPDIAQHTCHAAREGKMDDILNSMPEQEKSSDPLYRARRIAWRIFSSDNNDDDDTIINLLLSNKDNEKEKKKIIKSIRNIRKIEKLHPQIYDAIYNKLEEASAETIPMQCLTEDELQELYDTSFQIQKDVVPEYHNHGNGIADHEIGWQKALKSEKYCDIDLDALFQNQEWIDFIRELIAKEETTATEK